MIAGQGTSTIVVDELEAGSAYTATVQISGFPGQCGDTASCSFIIEPPPGARKFDEYGSLAFRDEKARLSNFAIELYNSPGAQDYIVAYTGRHRHDPTQARLNRARTYLITEHKIDAARIVTLKGGRRNAPLMELWIVPTGARQPQPGS